MADEYVWQDLPAYSGPAAADSRPWYAQTLDTLISAAATSRYRAPTVTAGQSYALDGSGRLVPVGMPSVGGVPLYQGGGAMNSSWLLIGGAVLVVVLLLRR